MFYSSYDIILDKQCGFYLPPAFVRNIKAADDGQRKLCFVMVTTRELRCYTPDAAKQFIDEIKTALLKAPARENMVMRHIIKNICITHCAFKRKLRLPADVCRFCRFEPGCAVILAGCGAYFEIWHKTDWQRQQNMVPLRLNEEA